MAIIETLNFQPAIISDIITETHRAKTFCLAPASPVAYVAGQHAVVRVTLPDGFRTSRHYSFSSAPSSHELAITIARAHDGMVSNWFFDTAKIGTSIDITQALGTMTWRPDQSEDILLIAGGIGITPLMGILREHKRHNHHSAMTLLYSARSFEELCFTNELFSEHKERVAVTLVESVPGDWQGHSGVIDRTLIAPLLKPNQLYYVCGPYGFVQHIRTLLSDMAISPHHIKVENFSLQ